jgi:hypothetical protein
MLQVVHIIVAKVGWDVACIASVKEACCKRLVRMFHMFLDVCCKRFHLDISCMLQVFYLDVAYVSLQVYVTNVSSALDVCCIQVFMCI